MYNIQESQNQKNLAETVQEIKAEDRDFKSNINKFCMLKTLYSTAELIHLNEIEIVYWHIINLKMMELGLWSHFKFTQ